MRRRHNVSKCRGKHRRQWRNGPDRVELVVRTNLQRVEFLVEWSGELIVIFCGFYFSLVLGFVFVHIELVFFERFLFVHIELVFFERFIFVEFFVLFIIQLEWRATA